MRRRSRASSKLAKARIRRTVKRRTASKDVHRPGASACHEANVARLTRERDEALERETANSEVLRLISKSPGNLELVFRTILETATRICRANFANLLFYEGDAFRVVAVHNAPPKWTEVRQRESIIHARPPHPLGRLAATK